MLMLSQLGNVMKNVFAATSASFNTMTMWTLVGVIGMFILGTIIYTCYSRYLGFPDEEGDSNE